MKFTKPINFNANFNIQWEWELKIAVKITLMLVLRGIIMKVWWKILLVITATLAID